MLTAICIEGGGVVGGGVDGAEEVADDDEGYKDGDGACIDIKLCDGEVNVVAGEDMGLPEMTECCGDMVPLLATFCI